MSSSFSPSPTSEENILKCVICEGDLADPVLLTCLHSSCSTCTRSDVSERLTCPTCQVTTDARLEQTNLFVSSLAHRSQVLKHVFSCTQCTMEDNPAAVAIVRCYTCQQSLCVDCQKCQSKLHSTHKVIDLNEGTNLSELNLPPARSCTKHYKKLKLACFTCKDERCYKCAHDCYISSHDVLPLDSPDALKRMNDSVAHTTRVLSDLHSSLTPLQAHLSHPEKILGTREESLAALKKAKKTAIDSISDAYEESAESLLECWDSLVVHSGTVRENVERLIRRVSWTNQYCKLALNSTDITGLLPQLDKVLSSLQTLLEEAKHFQEPADPSTLVRFDTWLPNDLNLIASGWFGRATVASDDVKSTLKEFPAEDGIEYYTRKVLTLKELESILQSQKQQQAIIQCEQQEMTKLQSEFLLKDQELVAAQNEGEKLRDQLKELQQQLENERRTVEQLQRDLNLKTQQHVATENEKKILLDQQREQQTQLDWERKTVEQLRSNLKFVATENEKKELLDQQREQQTQLDRERRTVEQLQSELKFATVTKPLSFDCQPRGTFKGPGTCFDVAVSPQGSLLVAAMADGLKEYDATSLQEIATWKPDADLLSQKDFWVDTVDVLSDGRALVGLNPKLIVLLRRSLKSSGGCVNSSDAEAWRVERRVADLQTPPRRLSTWGDRLLAVLEDRNDVNTKQWQPGPGLVLFSLIEGDKQLHRQQLEYDAVCIAVTDRSVIVASNDQVELTDAVGSSEGNRKCYVVDCYSHVGVRLWRHEVGGGLKVMSICSDSVGRVIYAAKSGGGPVVALSVDNGRELSRAITLSTAETETSYAIALDTATQCRLVLITRVGDDSPNSINIFSVSRENCE